MKKILFSSVIILLLIVSCGEEKKYKKEVKPAKAPPVPLTVYKDAGPHPVMQIIKDILAKYPVQTYNIRDYTAMSQKRSSLAPRPIKTLKLTDYYLIYTSEDSLQTWCWNLRQYAVVVKIKQKDYKAPITKSKVTKKKDAKRDSTAAESTIAYHLYISLN